MYLRKGNIVTNTKNICIYVHDYVHKNITHYGCYSSRSSICMRGTGDDNRKLVTFAILPNLLFAVIHCLYYIAE